MLGTLDKLETREWVVAENEGQQIFGVLHRPTTCDHPPVVVILHGFASSKLGSNRCYVLLAEALAKSGVAALRFDFRGSGDSEGSLSNITLEDLVSDAIAVLEKLPSIEGINADRIALFGSSLGGAIAILAAERFQKIRTMALWAPVASGELWFRDFLLSHPEYAQVDPINLLSSYRGVRLHPAFREQFAKLFAYKTLQGLLPLPTLLMQGEKDDVVSIKHHEAFRQACASSANTCFLTFPTGEHSLGFSPHFPEIVEEVIQWFQKHL